jgi:hypothetical protein
MGTKEEAQIKYAVGWDYNHLTSQMWLILGPVA